MKSLFAVVAIAVSFNVAPAAVVTPAASAAGEREATASRSQVTLVSDGETWVSIAKVQPPSKFRAKKVSLPPGDYEVIGRRRGYRDELKSLRVRSGENYTVTIICTVSADSRAP